MLADAGYPVTSDYSDQTEIQYWDNVTQGPVAVRITYLYHFAAFESVFGYYFDHNLSTFTPLLQTGSTGGVCPSAPTAAPGEEFNLQIPQGTFSTLGFAICSEFNGELQPMVATEAALNNPHENLAITFNPEPGVHIIAFEENSEGSHYWDPDKEYNMNDVIVRLVAEGLGGTEDSMTTPVRIEDF
jgi:hypothetical protein